MAIDMDGLLKEAVAVGVRKILVRGGNPWRTTGSRFGQKPGASVHRGLHGNVKGSSGHVLPDNKKPKESYGGQALGDSPAGSSRRGRRYTPSAKKLRDEEAFKKRMLARSERKGIGVKTDSPVKGTTGKLQRAGGSSSEKERAARIKRANTPQPDKRKSYGGQDLDTTPGEQRRRKAERDLRKKQVDAERASAPAPRPAAVQPFGNMTLGDLKSQYKKWTGKDYDRHSVKSDVAAVKNANGRRMAGLLAKAIPAKEQEGSHRKDSYGGESIMDSPSYNNTGHPTIRKPSFTSLVGDGVVPARDLKRDESPKKVVDAQQTGKNTVRVRFNDGQVFDYENFSDDPKKPRWSNPRPIRQTYTRRGDYGGESSISAMRAASGRKKRIAAARAQKAKTRKLTPARPAGSRAASYGGQSHPFAGGTTQHYPSVEDEPNPPHPFAGGSTEAHARWIGSASTARLQELINDPDADPTSKADARKELAERAKKRLKARQKQNHALSRGSYGGASIAQKRSDIRKQVEDTVPGYPEWTKRQMRKWMEKNEFRRTARPGARAIEPEYEGGDEFGVWIGTKYVLFRKGKSPQVI